MYQVFSTIQSKTCGLDQSCYNTQENSRITSVFCYSRYFVVSIVFATLLLPSIVHTDEKYCPNSDSLEDPDLSLAPWAAELYSDGWLTSLTPFGLQALCVYIRGSVLTSHIGSCEGHSSIWPACSASARAEHHHTRQVVARSECHHGDHNGGQG